jgi:hypothetical protein
MKSQGMMLSKSVMETFVKLLSLPGRRIMEQAWYNKTVTYESWRSMMKKL